MAAEVPQNEEISGEEENGDGKRAGYAICGRRANSGYKTLRKKKEEELFREMLTSTSSK